ncbi:hypothetical protein ASG89_15585 [Paenibacillus sp. Soil766]|nr:hypothetical protein ASG89_15585 [Paenibacillus sp. Soil766]
MILNKSLPKKYEPRDSGINSCVSSAVLFLFDLRIFGENMPIRSVYEWYNLTIDNIVEVLNIHTNDGGFTRRDLLIVIEKNMFVTEKNLKRETTSFGKYN